MAAVPVFSPELLIPTQEECTKIITAKLEYEAAKQRHDFDKWKSDKKNWTKTPWGISYNASKAKYDKAVAAAQNKGWNRHNGYKQPQPKTDEALRYFIIAVAIDWQELVEQLKRTLKNWGYTTTVLKSNAVAIWQQPSNAKIIAERCETSFKSLTEQVKTYLATDLTESVEKHNTLNSKLFTKEELLKDKVRDKMLEIVDEFLADLKEQDVKIKVDDILLIGSNASYNYTKDSDIDLHIIANAKAANYTPEVADALYSAYRSLFNKQLDIRLFGIPLEIFVETEDSSRVSNGIYSVKKNKWVKKPVAEDIPEYDTKALDELVGKWEAKCKELIKDIKADKLTDEKQVIKMLEDIYDKLRKNGISKGEYSIENLAFKELRNKGHLDQLKEYRNELVSKRLSLEETLDIQAQHEMYRQLTKAANGNKPLFQNNEVFYIYNLKDAEVSTVLNNIRKLPFVVEAQANESGKYDFSNVLDLAMNKMPKKFYNIRGRIKI